MWHKWFKVEGKFFLSVEIEGKKERRKEEKKERRKEGKKERRKEGKKERRKEGKKERKKETKKHKIKDLKDLKDFYFFQIQFKVVKSFLREKSSSNSTKNKMISTASYLDNASRISEIQGEFYMGWLLSGFVLFSGVSIHKLANIDDRKNFKMPPILKKSVVVTLVFVSIVMALATAIEYADHWFEDTGMVKTNTIDNMFFWVRECMMTVYIVVMVVFGRYLVLEKYR
jgi:hypothetical protein